MSSGNIGLDARAISISILTEVFEKGEFCNKAVEVGFRNYPGLSKADRSLIQRICLGTVERRMTIDFVIGKLSGTPFKKIKPFIRNLLRMTIYQILFMEVEDYAACDCAVKLVRRRNMGGLSGYVNAVCRSASRQKEELLCEIEKAPLGIRYSIPDIIISKWKPYHSEEELEKAFRYFLEENSTSIRCNKSRITEEELVSSLEADGASVSKGSCTPGCFKIKGYDSLLSLTAFNEGLFQVQDESSALVGLISGIKAGDKVIDVCAAPGGKTIHAADILRYCEKDQDSNVKGSVKAFDISEKKLELIRENVKRCRFDNIELGINDAEVLREELVCSADVVIADLPCSGLGIIGKKPDIKYHTDEEKLSELVHLQRNMLKVVTKYVKPGGTFIFSTCTVNRKENEENVSFICRETGYRPVSMTEYLPECLRKDSAENGMLQVFPGECGTDGFFIAKFVRPGE